MNYCKQVASEIMRDEVVDVDAIVSPIRLCSNSPSVT